MPLENASDYFRRRREEAEKVTIRWREPAGYGRAKEIIVSMLLLSKKLLRKNGDGGGGGGATSNALAKARQSFVRSRLIVEPTCPSYSSSYLSINDTSVDYNKPANGKARKLETGWGDVIYRAAGESHRRPACRQAATPAQQVAPAD